MLARNVPQELKERFGRSGARVLERDDGTVLTFSHEDAAGAAVREIVVAGGRLVSLLPHRDTLETLFVQRARGAAHP